MLSASAIRFLRLFNKGDFWTSAPRILCSVWSQESSKIVSSRVFFVLILDLPSLAEM